MLPSDASPLTTPQPSLTADASPLPAPHSSLTAHRSPLTAPLSSLTAHRSPLTASLITGVNGFVGKHLSAHLLSKNRAVVGIDIQEECAAAGIRYFKANICDSDAMTEIFNSTRPREIFHCAAISSPHEFHLTPYDSFQINLMGTISLFEAMRTSGSDAVMLVIGSAKQYKAATPSQKISETDILGPASYYGVSKYAGEMIGRYYIEQHGLDIRFTRSFNHTGPGQSMKFVCSDWARQIALIDLKKSPSRIFVGNTDVGIDFSDVRDVAEAYRLIVEKGKKGEAYNVCSNKGASLKYILKYLIAKSPLKISVRVQQEKVKAHAAGAELIGDNRKLREATGWSPRLPIEKTLDDLYDWWKQELK